jgi:hypothetical protein
MPESGPAPEQAVLLLARDLFFRARLEAAIRAAGRTPVSQGAAGLAVVELADAASVERVRALVAGGTAVVAFGAHVRGELLRAARAAGAEAVANAGIEAWLRRRLTGDA